MPLRTFDSAVVALAPQSVLQRVTHTPPTGEAFDVPKPLSRGLNTILAYAPYLVWVAWARWLAGNAIAQRLFFAREVRLMNDVYEGACGIRLDDRAVQGLLMAKTLRMWLLYKIPKFSDRDLERYVRIVGLDRVREINRSGQGIVLASSHFVNSACLSTVLARLDVDFRSVRRSMPKWRPSYGQVRYIFVGGDNAVSGFREISKILKTGGLIHSLFDGLQGMGTIARPFLGKNCRFRRALIEMAWTEGAVIIPTSVRLDLDGTILIEFHESFSSEKTDIPMKEAAAGIIERYAAFLEATIRAHPGCFDPARLELFWRRTSVDEADGARPTATP